MQNAKKTVAGIIYMAMCMALLVPGTVGAETLKIENHLLAVELSGQVLKLHAKPANLTFIPEAVFAREIEKAAIEAHKDAVWGSATQLRIEHVDGWQTLIRLYPKHPFAHLQTIAGNRTGKAVFTNIARIMTCRYDLGRPAEELRAMGTGGLSSVRDGKGSYTFSVIASPETRSGVVCGWLTHERGVGVFFPGVEKGRPVVRSQIDFGRFRVAAGKSRPAETMLIGYFSDARLGLEAYADSVARHYAIKPAPELGVYCSWYVSGASNERQIAENTEFAASHLKPFGLAVMQIDDGWQAILPKGFKHEGRIKTTGPVKVFVDSKGNYPKGMAHTAREIASHGMIPGIWFMPFAGNFRNPYFDNEIFAKNPDGTPFHDARWSGTCIDMSNPKAEAFVRKRVKRIYDWGYRYFKIDGMHTGMPSYNIYVNTAYRPQDFSKARLHDPDTTLIEAYRKGLRVLREEAPGTFILGCNVSQNMGCMGAAFGMIDAMRIGPDNGGGARGNWRAVTAGAWHGTNLYFLNGRVWHNDPDPVYVRKSNPVERARWMCSWLAVSGGMHTTSEQYSRLPADRLEMLRRCLPSHSRPARPVDYLETNKPRIWLVEGDGRAVIGLFNWHEKEADEIRYDMGKLGLDARTTYVAFDFWENKFVEPIRGTLKQTLPPGTCRILAVRPSADHPQLLSTSRHIAQCVVDVLEEKWDPKTRTLTGKSKVVAGDPYELRIAVPGGAAWKAKVATVGTQAMKPGRPASNGLRLTHTPKQTGTIEWQVQFE